MVETEFTKIISELNNKIDSSADKNQLNQEISLVLNFVRTYYSEDFIKILNDKTITGILKKMDTMISFTENKIKNYTIFESLNVIQINFTNGMNIHSKLTNLPLSLSKNFRLDPKDPFYWIISAYLSEETQFNLIQIYCALFECSV